MNHSGSILQVISHGGRQLFSWLDQGSFTAEVAFEQVDLTGGSIDKDIPGRGNHLLCPSPVKKSKSLLS